MLWSIASIRQSIHPFKNPWIPIPLPSIEFETAKVYESKTKAEFSVIKMDDLIDGWMQWMTILLSSSDPHPGT